MARQERTIVVDFGRLEKVLGMKLTGPVQQIGPSKVQFSLEGRMDIPVLSDAACKALDNLPPVKADQIAEQMGEAFERAIIFAALEG